MSWFINRRIGTKLLVVFTLFGIILTAIGGFGLFNLYRLNDSQMNMYTNNLIAVDEAHKAQSDYAHLRIYIRNMYMSTDEAEREQVLQEIHMTKAELLKDIESYRSVNLSKAALEAIAPFEDAWSTYSTLFDTAVNYNLAGDNERMKKLIDGELKSKGEVLREILQENVELNVAAAEESYKKGQALFSSAFVITVTVIVLGIAICIALGIIITRLIAKPLSRIVNLANKVAEGDLREKAELQSKDEVGVLAKAFNEMIERLNQTVGSIINSSHNVASAAEQISASTQEMAGSNTNQAHAAQTIHALFGELTNAIQAVARSTESASELSDSAIGVAREGRLIIDSSVRSMSGVREQMSQLEQDSHQIGDIIEVIEEIADQTNLLALNAAIEAARAGEQGRGFTVVADEVRKLAERSGTATKQITAIIKGMQENTKRSVVAVEESATLSNQTGDAFEQIVRMVNETGQRITEIAAASEEQAAQAENVLVTVEEISAATEEAAAGSQETAATAQSLAQLADDLQHSVSAFKTAS
ncbi:methyl-accepting chemotaxis protein [Paenibacillus radicis (ex Gao et al. 2016)]|uniref:Methyl-accepting chemotaxis protein n=1 Tax=Paenibacillus radicis (ex Gao et al. 2016) TaxID=1737354 RepID=A0A917LR84_9BACL|nr:methyl-accepting chemotaxis protein [Paenibacillus radicis (ex Gao et al. 2016)]GGG52384.1 methyl-accepting chemotaxis protein [Paenibacillus radicis (ex Gao et al. 2016)]